MISCATQSVRAQSSTNELSCFTPQEISHLAAFKKSCDVCKLDLADTKKAFDKCVDAGAPAKAWWADPKLVVGGFAISLSVGALLGVVLSK